MDKTLKKQFKESGKKTFHKHYLFLVLLCLILSYFGTEGGLSVSFLQIRNFTEEQQSSSLLNSSDVFDDIASGDFKKGAEDSEEIQENIVASADNPVLGRTHGVLAGMINAVSSGRLYLDIARILRSLTKTDEGAALLFMSLEILLTVLIWIFLRNVYSAILRRTFLELRLYDQYPLSEILHFAEVRCWVRASWAMFVRTVFLYLWSLTIIGGFIKYYSYYAVPYIVAENPGISAREAITLSRKMMDGHKKEAFLFDLSFIGWIALGIVTLGVSDLFYGLPYRMAARSEFYVWLRSEAKEKAVPFSEKLDDTFLFEKADRLLLYETYFDVVDRQVYIHENEISLSRIRTIASSWFSIWIGSLQDKKTYEELEGIRYEIANDTNRRDGRAYPSRLNPRYHKNVRRLKTPFTFLRSYSIWTLILLFLLFSVIGWGWEVSLHLINGDGFINRGMMHGPWIPIYGTGGIVALMLCSHFRKKPVQEFFFSVILCGVLEYLGSYILETRYHERWWSYDGNFLNLQGRICAEGLIVFGIACMLVVYLIAPLFDYVLSNLKKQVLVSAAVVLISIFAVDLAYSSVHPNMVKGAIVADDPDAGSDSTDMHSSDSITDTAESDSDSGMVSSPAA